MHIKSNLLHLKIPTRVHDQFKFASFTGMVASGHITALPYQPATTRTESRVLNRVAGRAAPQDKILASMTCKETTSFMSDFPILGLAGALQRPLELLASLDTPTAPQLSL